MISQNKNAFTLVELIVVITILAILATIWFISFIWYQKSARESTRLSDVKLIEKQLSIYEARNSTIPLPDNSVTITASGTTIWYQWEIGTWVLVTLKQAGDIKDPLDSGRYSFFVDNTRNNYQMMAMMEKEESLRTSFLPHAYATIDYTERYPRIFWVALWILTDLNNTPLEKIDGVTTLDVFNYSGAGYTAHYSDSENITGTGEVLHEITQDSNCKRIKQLSNSKDGVYTINPKWSWDIEVYCEMDMDGGWWVLIARSVPWINTNFWWLTQTWSISDDSIPYSMWGNSKKLNFSDIAYVRYSDGKVEWAGWKIEGVDDTILKTEQVWLVNDGTCAKIGWTPDLTNECYRVWWDIWNSNMYEFWWNASHPSDIWLRSYEFFSNRWGNTIDGLQFMIFVR